MKQKFFHAALVILIFSFGLNTQLLAQTNENTKAPSGALKYANDAQYMQTPVANTGVYKTESGIAEVDANGTVTATSTDANGQTVVSVIVKPTIDMSVEFGTELETYTNNYILWLKANPAFENYISAPELEIIHSGNFENLYRHNHNAALKQTQNK